MANTERKLSPDSTVPLDFQVFFLFVFFGPQLYCFGSSTATRPAQQTDPVSNLQVKIIAEHLAAKEPDISLRRR